MTARILEIQCLKRQSSEDMMMFLEQIYILLEGDVCDICMTQPGKYLCQTQLQGESWKQTFLSS